MTIDFGNLRIEQTPQTAVGANPDLGYLSRLPGKWSGPGFNAIWRPNGRAPAEIPRFVLELNRTTETLEFAEVEGNIINRVLSNTPDTQLRAVSYLQQISDSKIPGSDGPLVLHVEPGFWLRIPATVCPPGGETVVRQALIPHGVSLLAQGVGMPIPSGELTFPYYDLMPFRVDSKIFGHDIFDEVINFIQHPERDMFRTTSSEGTTGFKGIVDESGANGGISMEHLQQWVKDPQLVLKEGLVGKNIKNITQLEIAVPIPPIYGIEPPPKPTLPAPPSPVDTLGTLQNKYGGGISSIPFLLLGNGPLCQTGPNAEPTQFEATFYIEEFEGEPQLQLQYTQRVLLSFDGFLWPHVSVANLRKQRGRQ